MTKLFEWDCDFCKHCDCDEYTEPCLNCKNNQRPSSKEYQTAPLLFELQDAPAIEDSGETIDIAEAIEKMEAAEGIKSAEVVLQLEVGDGSALRVAHAICKESVQTFGSKENALIYLDELTEHIDAYVRAERKALEYKKMAEEG